MPDVKGGATTQSLTPRTNAVVWLADHEGNEAVDADFARQLERELAKAHATLAVIYDQEELPVSAVATCGWIPVGERLPDLGRTVLLGTKVGVTIGWRSPNDLWMNGADEFSFLQSEVSHWMPLPTFPGKDCVSPQTNCSFCGKPLSGPSGAPTHPDGCRDDHGGSNPPPVPKDADMVKRLHATTDASVWAADFNTVFKALHGFKLDEGWLIGWFANAIETGRDAGKASLSANATSIPVPRRFLQEFITAIHFYGGHGTPTLDRAYAESLYAEALKLLGSTPRPDRTNRS